MLSRSVYNSEPGISRSCENLTSGNANLRMVFVSKTLVSEKGRAVTPLNFNKFILGILRSHRFNMASFFFQFCFNTLFGWRCGCVVLEKFYGLYKYGQLQH